MTGVELVRVAGPDLEVELIPELGARLHRLRAFGRDVLRTPADPARHRDEPVVWGAYPMAPWCNRLAAVPTRVGDRVVALGSNFGDGTAIHGQVFTTPWTVVGPGHLATTGGGDGWPWHYEVVERVAIDGPRLAVELVLTNRDNGPMPAGVGLHPWFVRPAAVRLAAARVVASNTDPASPLEPVHGPFALNRLAPAALGLDATWTDLAEPAIELDWPELGLTATATVRATADRAVPAAVALASPADIEAIAIEPQTHLPGGLRRYLDGTPGGLVLLAPGASLGLEIELRFSTR